MHLVLAVPDERHLKPQALHQTGECYVWCMLPIPDGTCSLANQNATFLNVVTV